MRSLSFLILFLAFALPASGSTEQGGEGALTLPRVIELSASAAPEVRLSATRLAEEKAKVAGAQVRTLQNPELELAAGPRTGDENSIDTEVGVEIPIELWGRRDKRIAFARAGLQREEHTANDVRRQSVSAAVGAYYRVLHAEERLRVAQERKTVAEELLRIATERHRAGDVPKFEVNLAKTEVARAYSDISAEQGRITVARSALAQSLGLSSGAELQVQGDIKDRTLFDALRSVPDLTQRPDLLSALADVGATTADVALAKAEQRPDVALRLSYQREGDENIALAGVSVGLPFLNPRRGPVQEALARKERARIAVEIRRAAISTEIEGARRAYEAAAEAVLRIERDGLALQRENESLAAESYRAGKINLSTLLQVRREALETRREYLERLLEAAEAGVGLASAVGTFPATN
jgi:cobalt-zinc-cadmium efflux system outer membrane protein